MKISCNRLKKYIKNSETIDWIKLWDKFTIRTAEVEGVEIKGSDMSDVVVAKIIECEKHPKKDKYNILKVTDGTNTYDILCGAPNVRKGLLAPLVKVGGMVGGITITAKKIAGFDSEGMLCAGDELGISTDHAGIIELSDDLPLGTDIKEVFPINDIIVEIDNKSLTNRPDLWGHYGIAREVAAITNHELLPLETVELPTNLNSLVVNVKTQELCKRYCGLKINNITENKTPMDLQIFLQYVGMRSISLIVDLTNVIMLELGQPMHAYDSRVVNDIVVDFAKEDETYTTLDSINRKLNKEIVLIKNKNETIGIAGIMGGLSSEIENDTTSLTLESAVFDSTCIRKGATFLGLRTEASIRYEKSLDPTMAPIAIKRFIKLLKEYNPNLEIASNLTDVCNYSEEENIIELTKEKLAIYMGEYVKDEVVVNILTSLGFIVTVEETKYIIKVPTWRSTKDITMDADIIEEISRMYGYENITPVPLKTDLTFKMHENYFEKEYEIKEFLASRYSLSEVNSYLWYDSSFLKQNDIIVDNTTVVNKKDNNILRDDLSLSLLPFITKNFKNMNSVNIFEIATVIKKDINEKYLSIVLANDISLLEKTYNEAKEIIVELVKRFKNKDVTFIKSNNNLSYYDEKLKKDILVDNIKIGTLNVVTNKVTNNIAKKKSIITIDIEITKFIDLPKTIYKFKELPKYPTVTLDYTVISDSLSKYEDISNIINKFASEFVLDYTLKGIFIKDDRKKYTIKFTVGSSNRTLTNEDLTNIKDSFINHIETNGLEIVK
ncbi:MAG: phenylalanine--tRNA ligase subunit beta [Bacilli bacterium]